MKVLVWQWGRFGAGPRFAACLADALRDRPGIEVTLSLSADAEIMRGPAPPRCELPFRTYAGIASLAVRVLAAPSWLPRLYRRLRPQAPDLAICAMPGPLDLLMVAVLRLLRARVVVVVHEADAHAGDGFPMQIVLQRLLCRCADGLAVLCGHVGTRLRHQSLTGEGDRKLIRFEHPPFAFDIRSGERPAGPPRLLCFGRLRTYKGLDLLAAALARVTGEIQVRVVGRGPETAALAALRALPGVTVENRWVPEAEIGALLSWSDALVLPYREASQSGVAAAALAAGRPVIATRVGGLTEQLAAAPGAVLCDPDPGSMARAIALWLRAPLAPLPRADAGAAWRDAASGLLQAASAILPGRHTRSRLLVGRKLRASRQTST
jgi:glycosyltransferase involved in cell wall biosynthesis